MILEMICQECDLIERRRYNVITVKGLIYEEEKRIHAVI